MMTVRNEQQSLHKYEYLVFVEFLDMLCRISSAVSKYQDTIDCKVYSFLEEIWDFKYKQGIWCAETHELKDINFDIELN